MPQAVTDALVHMGLPGLVILGMGWWILRQDARIEKLQGELSAEKDKRAESATKMAEAALDITDALKEQSNLLSEIKGKIT